MLTNAPEQVVLTPLCLRFLICEMEELRVSFLLVLESIKRDNTRVENWSWYVAKAPYALTGSV